MAKDFNPNYGQYLDVFPFVGSNILDAYRLSDAHAPFVTMLPACFTSGAGMELILHLEQSPQDKRLFHLFVEAQNMRHLQGKEVLSVGYPFLLAVEEEEMLSMPLFFRPVSLSPLKQEGDWSFQIKKNERIRVNPFLEQLLRKKGLEKCADKVVQLRAKNYLRERDFLEFIGQLSKELSLSSTGERPTLLAFPSTDEMGQMAQDGFIQWSAAIGIFPEVNLIDESAFDIFAEAPPPFPFHSFGLNSVDSAKVTAIQQVKEHYITLISGAVGSGKTHLLQYLISNALLKGGKSLIISPRLNNLREIQNLLEKEGLGSLNYLFQDGDNDGAVWKNILQARLKEKGKKSDKEVLANFRILLQEYLRKKRKMDAAYSSTRVPIFGDKNWEEVAGLFLHFNELEKWQLLDSFLIASDFSFTEIELQEITDGILLSKPIFEKLGTIQHPLRNLNAGIFVHHSVEEGRGFVLSKVTAFLKKGGALQRRIIIVRNEYADALMSYYSDYYYRLEDEIASLRDLIHDFKTRYDEDLFDAGTWALKINGLLQSKYMDILQAREKIRTGLDGLQTMHEQMDYFDFSFTRKSTSLSAFTQKINDYEADLNSWWQSIGGKVQDELLRLSAKTVQASLMPYRKKIQGLEKELDIFVEELNATGLYHLPFSANMLTLSKKQKYLEEILGQLEETDYHLRDFDLFFDWQSLWYTLSQETRRVLAALIKVKPDNWINAFKSWYYFHLLSNHQSPVMPVAPYDLEGLHQIYEQLNQSARAALPDIWNEKAEIAKSTLKTTHKKLFRQMMDKKEGVGMRELFAGLSEPILELNPICLSSVSQLANWTNIPDFTFDYLLVEEGQLVEENILPLFTKAKRVVVFNTPVEEQIIPFALPEILKKEGVHEVLLSTDNPEQKKLVPGVKAVNGYPNEATGINERELSEVIRLLNEIKVIPGRKLPSVAMVFTTPAQRDAVFRSLLTIKQKRLPGFEIILQLERNGLALLTVDELPGQQFDTVLWSLGFDEAASFINTGLSRWDTYSRIIYERSKNSLTIIHSLSQKELAKLQKETANTSAFTTLLSGNSLAKDKKRDIPESSFVTFVKEKLQSKYPNAKFTSEGHYLRRIGDEGTGDTIILPNACFARTPAISFKEEYHRQRQLREQGVKIEPVFPVLWWRG